MYLTNLFTVGCIYQKKTRCYESKIHTKPVQITCTYDEIYWIWTIVFLTQHAQFTLGERTWPQYILESHLMKSWYEKRYPAKFGLELDLPTNQSFIHELQDQATCWTATWPPISVAWLFRCLWKSQDNTRRWGGIWVVSTYADALGFSTLAGNP